MLRFLPSLWNVRGFAHALLGSLAALASLPVAIMVLLVPVPREWRVPALLVASVAVLMVAGIPRVTRAGSVRLANGLLGTRFPSPRPDRLRTAVWLPIHAAIGTAVMIACLLLAAGAVSLVAVWLSGGGEMSYFFARLWIERGAAGAWTLPLALAHPVAAGGLNAAGVWLSRRLATRLLGPNAEDRAAEAAAAARDLARRNRLARELHDSIGHTLTASTIQAAVANQLLDSDPDAARQALDAIEGSARSALADLDHVLGELRREGDPRSPRPDLSEIHRLVAGAQQCGYTVDTEIDARLTRIPATVSREAYGFMQEGITNALKYACAPRLRLRIERSDDALYLEVTNPTASSGTGTGGRGLLGLTERINSLGGELTTETGPKRWRLMARLPLRSRA